MAKNRATHVVVDTVAFFRNVQLQDIAENVYTTQGVVNEIKDAATRQRLAVLPYDLKYRDPSSESLTIISEFAKKTGDYRSLSLVDLKVLALTYQLTKEHCGTDHLNLAPEKKVTLTRNTRPLVKATDIVGFYLPPKDTKHQKDKEADSTTQKTDEVGDIELTLSKLEVEENGQEDTDNRTECEAQGQRLEEEVVPVDDKEINNDPIAAQEALAERISETADGSQSDAASLKSSDAALAEMDKPATHSHEILEDDAENVEEDRLSDEDGSGEREEDSGSEGDDEEEDEEGWITPENISRIRKGSGRNWNTAEGLTVGCMTADFAMQNVLIQMGIPVLSVEGMLIKTAKSFVLRCRACFKTTNNMTKVFCPHCGNKTLDKVTVTTEEDGSQRIHLSHRKVINKRGLKYPLPLPKGGKHADNPILVEDQPIPQNRLSHKAQMKTDVFNADYVAGSSPFALKDTTSKSAQLGVRSFVSNAAHHRRNPNQVKPRRGRKK